MPRRFTDASTLFADLLDRHEAGTQNPIAYPDYAAFASVVAADDFLEELRQAEQRGAVALTWGKGTHRDQLAHVRLKAPEVLYHHLNRRPIASLASDAHAQLVDGLAFHPSLAHAASHIASVWSRAKSWNGLSPQDAPKLRNAFKLAQAILDQQHEGMDYRTFSRRITVDSKALERMEGVVVRLLREALDLPSGAKPREALRILGLEKFSPPLLIAGGINLMGADLSRENLVYLGMPPAQAERLRFRQVPAYLLTIENFASFNRHVIEADPKRLGTTIFVGGYPSLATQHALRVITSMLPASVPIFHWSDIDPDGVWIFRTIEQAIGRRIRPHLMSEEIATQLGTATVIATNFRPCPNESGVFPLAQYLARQDAKTLEQEELDPCLPNFVNCGSTD